MGTMPLAIGRALRRLALPLAWYYAVTLAIPLANGAGQAGIVFVWHALAVLVVPPFLIVVASGAREMARAITGSWPTRIAGNPTLKPEYE
jgi:hypothetical protein